MAGDPLTDDEAAPFRFTSNYSPEFDPFYHEIGQLAVYWSEFEFAVNTAIWELANVSRMAGTCMTSQLIGPGPRFRCLVSLLNLREAPEPLIKAVNSLSSKAEELGRRRNRFLHDPIVMQVDQKKMYRMGTTADRKVKHGMIAVSTKEITDLTGEIDQLTNDFEDVYQRVITETAPWPRTQYEQSKGIRRQWTRRESGPSTPERPPESSRA
jgi:hypothetical protein